LVSGGFNYCYAQILMIIFPFSLIDLIFG